MAGSSTDPNSHALHIDVEEQSYVSEKQPERKGSQEDFNEKKSAPSLDTFNTLAPTNESHESNKGALSPPSQQRADVNRLNDDLELLRAERFVSNQEHDAASYARARQHNEEPEDAFNQPDPAETFRVEGKKKDPDAALFKLWLFLRKFPRFIRYFVYLIPGAAILLIPVLLGALAFNKSDRAVGGRGGVQIMWFGIWLEIIWGSFWVTRMITSLMPHLFKGIAKMLGSATPKKWRDIGEQLELPTALFLWFLAILISYGPVVSDHRIKNVQDPDDQNWISIVRKIIIALFTLIALNFVEKILIQWIATSFHQRTYATRMENNKADTRQLVHLFEHAKAHLEQTDTFWKQKSEPISGSQTPMQTLQDNARQVLGKVQYVAGRVGNDLIGRKVDHNQPRKVVSELLRNTSSAHTLARLIYRSLVKEGRELILPEDMREAFQTDEEFEAAFSMFDKDMNGDISLEEFEAVTNEIHLEKKAIGASLKDLDSVIKKLDKVFVFFIVIISIVVFISILSGSAAAALGSAGTVILGLAWVLQATAQEFLQSIIFVFVKHPFDVGDRVTVYGSTGDTLTGDDYYVTEISLLYTEFKKMQGHIVQAPNSLLNTLFILNQRRSNGLADVIPLQMRFGTPQHMIDELKARMLLFCQNNKRDYQPNIISEMTKLDEVRSCTMNMVFFHKSNFQNELLRLNRHNKFVTELMAQMVDIGIQAPYRVEPGGSRENPMYWANLLNPPTYSREQNQDDSGDNYQGPPLSHQQSAQNYRGNSVRAAERSFANMDAAIGDFQDVFDSRRENIHAHRLASIKEKERGLRVEQEAVESHASSSGLERVRTSQESRYRVFTRPRSKSKAQHQGEIV